MGKRVETLTEKIAQLQAQLQQAKAAERQKERKLRTRQSIIGFTTIEACLAEGVEVHLKTPEDLDVFLRQHVKGTNNRKTWGFETSETAAAEVNDNHPAPPKPKAQRQPLPSQDTEPLPAPTEQTTNDTTGKRERPLKAGPSQDELKEEFEL
jgi:hypothetical protein